MKIVMLLPDPAVRGAMAGLGRHLLDALWEEGVEVLPARWGRHADRESALAALAGRIGDLRRIRRLLRQPDVDVLFVNTAHDARALARDVPLLVATRRGARRRVVQFHGSWSELLPGSGHTLLKWASRWLARNVDLVLLLSTEEVTTWKSFEPHGRYAAVANPYQHNPAFDVLERRETSADGIPVILFVGRLLPAKGVFDLLDAFARLRSRCQCRLVYAGDGPAHTPLAERAQAMGLKAHVDLLGHLGRADLARAYSSAAVFALPSHSEGFATVLAEAMDAGLPIVTTGIRGALDQLEEGRNALLVPPARADLLADALHRLLTDAELRHAMSVANRERVWDFAPAVVAREYVRRFEMVLEEGTLP